MSLSRQRSSCGVVSLSRHNRQCLFLTSYPTCLHLIYLFACSSASHLLVVCSASVLFLPPPQKNSKCVPHWCFTNTFFHSTTLILNPILPNPLLPNPLLPNPCCAPYTLPLGHPPCYTPNPFHPLPYYYPYPQRSPTHHLVPWKIAINRSARAVFAEWDRFGFLFGDTVWAVLNTPPRWAVAGQTRFSGPS